MKTILIAALGVAMSSVAGPPHEPDWMAVWAVKSPPNGGISWFMAPGEGGGERLMTRIVHNGKARSTVNLVTCANQSGDGVTVLPAYVKGKHYCYIKLDPMRNVLRDWASTQ